MVAIENSVPSCEQSIEEILRDTTCDGLLDQRVRFYQPKQGYRVALDTVLLAASVPAKPHDRVADLGCGVGGVLLALTARVPNLIVEGYEIQEELAKLARYNCSLNPCASAATITWGDIRSIDRKGPLYHYITMNPPYYERAQHSVSPHESKRLAHTEDKGDLAKWIETAFALLEERGALCLIHRWQRESELLLLLQPYFDKIDVLRIQTKSTMEPKRVIIRCWKASENKGLVIYNNLILHSEDGAYTKIAHTLLRDCGALSFNSPLKDE